MSLTLPVGIAESLALRDRSKGVPYNGTARITSAHARYTGRLMDLNEQLGFQFRGPERRVWTVRALVESVRGLVERQFSDCWVEGEISDLRSPGSGHLYFTLKEESAQIRVVMFRSSARLLAFVRRTVCMSQCAGGSRSMKNAASCRFPPSSWSHRARARCNWPSNS